MAFAFQRKVEHDIDGKFTAFEQSNELKRIEFIVSIFGPVFFLIFSHAIIFTQEFHT